MQVMKASTSLTGALQMPRTLLTIILPTIAGVWVGKKTANAWKAMVVATVFVVIPMAMMAFTTPSTSIMLYFIALTVTGIAESFRAVSITPTAQATLEPHDMGVGTSLVNFANSLAQTISAAAFAVAYNACTASDPTNTAFIKNGVNAVFIVAAVVTAAGFILAVAVIRPLINEK